ncbi:acyl-CoA dehydrogenase family protein [Pseudenhygromyxa sp. WMMC2535]|uniref:acyl-CoA dehydrogenase family protein n=1 Tax=Pseudenhygromyxa sp. WMMC2535 TaxID=2712867 RepID=UPI00155179D0|nr:acyl-CoA dehydrogenase family protein [Pseudenhygromyxa sp. WMMC2535]NVB43242.1 acyl-CoA dehydrogenase family protein [Pseudenhygromyxa sp. WMMC2535]
MSASAAFVHTRILERDLATIHGLPELREQWCRLEDRLEQFCSGLETAPVDESDVHAATREYVARLAAAGFCGLVVPGEFGGAHERVSATAICLTRQWLARHSGALDTAFVMQGLGSYPVAIAGQPALKRALLPAVARGERICAFALTEPEAGSDVSGMQTVATPQADGGVCLRGHKTFISNAGVADSYVVFAREAEPNAEGKPRYGAFWLPGDAPGLSVEAIEVTAPHPIGTVHFVDVAVPAEHRLGEPGEGLRIALGNLDQFRATVGAAALGIADRAIHESVRHLQTRVQFGRPLAKQQGLRFALAEIAADHVAAQLMVYRAAAARDRGEATPDQPAMGKLLATEHAQRAVDRCVQNFGGRGVVVGEVPERLYREVRALRIYEGTSEVQKLVIARAML